MCIRDRAHGIWSCHRRKNHFNNASFSGIPYDFGTALRFPGAWDYSFAKSVFEEAKLYDTEPAQELLENPIPGCYCCKAEGKVAVYLPYNSEVILNVDVSKWHGRMIILAVSYTHLDVYKRQVQEFLPVTVLLISDQFHTCVILLPFLFSIY